MFRTRLTASVLMLAFALAACSSFGPVYPSRPPATPGTPPADAAPSRLVVHVAVTSAALRGALDEAVPKTGEGTFPLLGSPRTYRWERQGMDVEFSQGRLILHTKVRAEVIAPVGSLVFPLDLRVQAEPVINSAYAVKLQSLDVQATSSDRRLKIADSVAGTLTTIAAQIREQLVAFAYDLAPLLREAHGRVAQPIELPLGGTAQGCVELPVLAVEAGPTVLADGIEKDLALVVAPNVLLPCHAPTTPRSLPPLANVAALPTGPFTVTIPVAARYEELTKAMGMAFTDGKYFFSAEHPKLYLENPELYEAEGRLVLKMHIAGSVNKFGLNADLNGDLFLVGRPVVVDNELRIPDLEPTIETSNFLLSLKAATDGQRIRDEARAALRLDLGERLRAVRAKLSSDLTFGSPQGCFQGDVDKVEVTGVYAHASYLRVYVAVTGRAAARMPCGGAG